jgi:hypothetical protein
LTLFFLLQFWLLDSEMCFILPFLFLWNGWPSSETGLDNNVPLTL